jgi:glycogen debranching enzyme
MSGEHAAEDLLVGDRYYILASSVAADLPKLVLKHDDGFIVADRRGDFPALRGSEFGYYVDDTRFVSQLELRGRHWRPLLLNATVWEDALEGGIDLTNPDIVERDRLVLPGRTLRISRRLMLFRRQLFQRVSIDSFARQAHELAVAWHFAADFADLFEVRGHPRPRRGAPLAPVFEKAAVVLGYRGLDGVTRRARFELDPPPARVTAHGAEYALVVAPGERTELSVTVTALADDATSGTPRSDWPAAAAARRIAADALRERATGIRSDHELFNGWIERSRQDVHLLLTDTPEGFVPYAGIPWYVAPFGRDSLITALQTLPFEPEVARGTLRFLARHQATADDAFIDAEPGKILHEYRRGEMANCREIPFVPYYGSVDATPLFLVLLAEYLRWTADVHLARELWPAAERALAWIEGFGDGFLTYQRRSPLGLDNQGWKDSQDAIMHADGEPAAPPIALVEVQGYAYAALLGLADVLEVMGLASRAPALRARAEALRERFEASFWLDDLGVYALALDGAGRPCRVVSSNPGHALWTGIAGEARAARVVQRLMADDVASGWGLRTLAAGERLYNPMSYHNGSVWPHDTAIAAVGMRAYGHPEAFLALGTALFQAVLHFEGARMPELFCGFPRAEGHGPTRYPVACSPQAWAAGSVFHLVRAMLGMSPDAPGNRLTLYRPHLPPWLRWIELHGLRLGASLIDLRVSQGREHAAVELLQRAGDAEIIVRG